MPRYIDAEKANEIMLNAMCGTGYQSRAMSAIDDTPTADVEEVKHGEWIEDGCMYRCSECGNLESYYSDSYCRCCGAKMDGKKGE